WIPRPERAVSIEIEQLLVRLHGCERHPIERKEQYKKNERKRKIERYQAPRQRVQIAHALGLVGERSRTCQHGFWIDHLAGESVSHCSLPAATCVVAARTTRREWRRAGMGSSRSKLRRLHPGSRS